LGSGVVLALVGTIFAYVKLDTWTRGYYTWRLRIAAGVVLLALVAVGIGVVAAYLNEAWRVVPSDL
jgi:uncharacterized membrane protein